MQSFLYSLMLLCLVNGSVQQCKAQGAGTIYKDTAVTNFFRRTTGCIAGDGGFSVPLSNNKVIWLMGDSHIDVYDVKSGTVPCLFQVRNTALLQPQHDWQSTNTKTLPGTVKGTKSFLKNQPNDSFFFWPGSGIQLKDTLYVYCNSLKNQGSGAFGFAVAGNDFMARIKLPEMTIAGYTELPGFKGIGYGLGFIQSGSWVYVYGQKYVPSKIECQLYVARFKANQPLNNWQFWDGKNWTNQAGDAAVIAAQTGVSGTFQVSMVKNKVLLLSSALSINCDSGTEMFAATANSLTGPFANKKLLYAIDDRLEGHSPFFYSVLAHPEYINDQDELLITYAINGYGTCVKDCVNDRLNPDVYRLKGIRVPTKLLIH